MRPRPGKILLSMGILFASLGLARSTNANLLTNPSFETGDLTGWLRTEANGGDSVVCAGDTPFFGGASEGACALQLNGGNLAPDAILEQTFATAAGVTYDLTFDIGDYSPSNSPGIASVLVEVLDGAVLLAGFPLTAADAVPAGALGVPTAPGDFASFAASFVATGSSTVLRITDQTTNGGLNFDTMLDNFVVVPEPTPIPSMSNAFILALSATMLILAALTIRRLDNA